MDRRVTHLHVNRSLNCVLEVVQCICMTNLCYFGCFCVPILLRATVCKYRPKSAQVQNSNFAHVSLMLLLKLEKIHFARSELKIHFW